MCGGGAPQTVRTDPVADAERAAAEAAASANSESAFRKKRRRQQSLLLTEPQTLGGAPQGSVLTGRTTLGG